MSIHGYLIECTSLYIICSDSSTLVFLSSSSTTQVLPIKYHDAFLPGWTWVISAPLGWVIRSLNRHIGHRLGDMLICDVNPFTTRSYYCMDRLLSCAENITLCYKLIQGSLIKIWYPILVNIEVHLVLCAKRAEVDKDLEPMYFSLIEYWRQS